MGCCGSSDGGQRPAPAAAPAPPPAASRKPAAGGSGGKRAPPQQSSPVLQVIPPAINASPKKKEEDQSPLAKVLAQGPVTATVDGEQISVEPALGHAYGQAIALLEDVRKDAAEKGQGRRSRLRWSRVLGWITKQGFKRPRDGPVGYRVMLFRTALRVIEHAEEVDLTSEAPDSARSTASGGHVDPLGTTDADAQVTPDELREVIKGLRQAQPLLPDIGLAKRIVKSFTQVTRRLPNVVELGIPQDGKLIIVGDTHGQLHDLLHIFDAEQWPSSTTLYLINGDYVDRGDQGVEIVLLLWSLKLLHPNSVFLNRGNHEEERVNIYNPRSSTEDRRMKFQWQVEEAYAEHAGPESLWWHIQASFLALPLIHVVQKEGRRKLAVVHGGLPDVGGPVTIEEINKIRRFVSCPKSRAAVVDGRKVKVPPESRADRILQCLLWSDPKVLPDDCRSEFSEHRGAGVMFGNTVCREFLRANQIDQHIIRSHETAHRGHVVNLQEADGRALCQTVFSASNYMHNTNMGAYVVATLGAPGQDVTLTPASYYVRQDGGVFIDRKTEDPDAPDPVFAGQGEGWTAQEVDSLTKTAMEFLGQLVFANRTKLLKEFQVRDKTQSGKVSKRNWVNVMKMVVSQSMPWWGLCRYLTQTDITGGIAYVNFCERFQNKLARRWMVAWCKELMVHLTSRVSRAAQGVRSQLQAKKGTGGRRFSRADNAKLSYQELCVALNKAMPGISPLAVYYLQVAVLDENSDGYLELDEWEKAAGSEREGACPGLLDLWMVIQNHGSGDRSPYGAFLKNFPRDGHPPQTFVAHAMRLCGHTADVQQKEWQQTAKVLAAKGKGKVQKAVVDAQVQAFGDSYGKAERIMEVIDAISRSNVELRKVFTAIDKDRSGKLSKAEFREGLELMQHRAGAHGSPLPPPDEWVDTLWAEADADGSGQIDIDEFLCAVAVQDTWSSSKLFEEDVQSRRQSFAQGRTGAR